eukprot:6723850-Prymnesium_polylepis.1
MWHKKWCLPQINVRATADGAPLSDNFFGRETVFAYVSAGTLGAGDAVLQDEGLNGECQRRLTDGSVSFARLSFRHT